MDKKVTLTLAILLIIALVYFVNFKMGLRQNSSSTSQQVITTQSINSVYTADKQASGVSTLSKNKFTQKELEKFKSIQKYYPEFKYSDEYVITSEQDKKMIFTKQDYLYFDIYITFHSVYHEEGFVNYTFDAGTAHRGYGTYYLIDENTVLKVEKSVGTSAFGYRIYKNGKKIDDALIEYDYYK